MPWLSGPLEKWLNGRNGSTKKEEDLFYAIRETISQPINQEPQSMRKKHHSTHVAQTVSMVTFPTKVSWEPVLDY